mmetsp:Transcript_26579/g.40639  ORF Transcript_26579/g.40639 Transcript_26579/m.40639 type:complete len:509 (-) Transcript_26579:232-1758(-)
MNYCCSLKKGTRSSETVFIEPPSTPWSDHCDIPERYNKQRCASIPDTHRRGISLKQLDEIGDLAKTVLERYEHINSHSKQRVTAENATLYDICDLFISPLTVENSSRGPVSFVELIAHPDSDHQDPKWFVSHWWGTSFFDTLRMLHLHAEHRGVSAEEEYYWICAFANCQHNLSELEEQDYRLTPFARAIMSEKTVGTVVLLTEEKAMPFYRSWCIFESFVSTTIAQDKADPHLMDFCTIVPEWQCESYLTEEEWKCIEDDQATTRENGGMYFNQRCADMLYQQDQIIPEASDDFSDDLLGPVPVPYTKYKDVSDHPYMSNLSWFPSAVSHKGLKVDILDAEASRECDKKSIQAWVGNSADSVNAVLRRSFFAGALVMAATEINDVENLKRVLKEGEDLFCSKQTVIHIANDNAVLNYAVAYTDDSSSGQWRDIALCLLEYGCDPDIGWTDKGWLPLQTAFQNNAHHHVRNLLTHGADVTIIDKSTIQWDSCPGDIASMLHERGITSM